MHGGRDIPVVLIVEVEALLRELVRQLVVHQPVAGGQAPEQGVTDDGGTHAVVGQGVGGELLLRLHQQLGHDVLVGEELVGPLARVVAGPQKNEGLIHKELHGHRMLVLGVVAVVQNVLHAIVQNVLYVNQLKKQLYIKMTL